MTSGAIPISQKLILKRGAFFWEDCSPMLIDQVDALWVKQKAVNPGLFDGTVTVLEKMEGSELIVSPLPYRFHLARLFDPQLRKAIPYPLVAVSGMVFSEKQLLLGKRSPNSSTHPAMWEAVPSGSVAWGAALEEALTVEAQEELGPLFYHGQPFQFFAALETPADLVIDFWAWVDLGACGLKLPQIGEEHTEFKWVQKKLLASEKTLPFPLKIFEEQIDNNIF